MAYGKFVSYLRVSTQRQGESGLGIEAQRETVAAYLNGGAWELLAEFVEVESGGKSDKERPQLRAALDHCRKAGAVLVFAKLDRLARDTRLVLDIADSGVPCVFCDFPEIPEGAAGRFLLTMLASVAEFERRRVSERTKAALAAAKARGVKLGIAGPRNLRANVEERKAAADAFATKLAGVVEGMRVRGLTQRAMVAELNGLGIKTARGGEWSLVQLQRVMARLAA